MNKDVTTLRAAISVVTRILAERNIPVVQRGLEAKVGYNALGEPIEIQVPYVPDDASPALIRAIHGFIDHEVGHVLDTDAKVALRYREQWARRYDSQQAGVIQNFQNILEDIYIEKQQELRFRGCGFNLGEVRQFVLDTMVSPRLSELTDNKDVCELLTFVVFRAWGGQPLFEQYLSDKWDRVALLVDKVPENLRQALRKINSTEDACQLAEALFQALTQAQPSDNPQQNLNQQPDDSATNESQQSSNAQESDDWREADDCGSGGDSTPQDSSDNSESGGSNTEDAKGDDQESSDDTDQSSDDNGSRKSESETDDAQSADKSKSDDGSTQASDAEEEQSGTNQQPGTGSGESSDLNMEAFNPESFDDLASRAIQRSAVEAAKSSDYMPYSEEWDDSSTWESQNQTFAGMKTPEMLDRVEHLIGPMAHALERHIKTKSLARWTPGYRRGRLDARATSRLALSKRHPELHTDRICKQREVSVTNDVCVSILVDCSGSMHGMPIQTAMDSAYGIAATLERIGIASEVTGFTTKDLPYDALLEMDKSEVANGLYYARVSALYMPTFKAFHERVNSRVTARFACFPREGANSMDTTILGEPIRLAYERLVQRPERGRLMIVLTDGEPASYTNHRRGREVFADHAKSVIESIEQGRQANILGIGIDLDVDHLFSRAFRVDRIEDLPSVLIRELKGYVIDHAHN